MSHLKYAAGTGILPDLNIRIMRAGGYDTAINRYINARYRFGMRFQSHYTFFGTQVPNLNISIEGPRDYIVPNLSPLCSYAYAL